jgi:hypothetical protein
VELQIFNVSLTKRCHVSFLERATIHRRSAMDLLLQVSSLRKDYTKTSWLLRPVPLSAQRIESNFVESRSRPDARR